MKYSVVLASTLAGLAMAKPQFLNTKFDVEEGEPFTLKYSGCENGCTITLANGDSGDLQTVQTLDDDATGKSTTVTLNGVPSDTYAFVITDNDTQEVNYSEQFKYQGTASTSANSSVSSAMSTSTSTSSTSSTSMSTSSSSMTTTTSSTSTGSSSTSSDMTSTSTSSAPASSTTAPDGEGAAGSLQQPIGLVAGVAAGLLALL